MTARYALIGAGGTGTLLLQPLARYLRTFHGEDNWLLAVIDGDTVEEKNLDRQLFAYSDINTTKAQAAASSSESFNVIAVPEFVSDDNITDLIKDGDTILIAADNYPVRARIERHVLTLDNAIVINGGNESNTGSCQIWVRQNGKNVTPPISFLHDEIFSGGSDPSVLSCTERARIQGDEQTIVANFASAMWMLTAIHKVLSGQIRWNDLAFDLVPGTVEAVDTSPRKGWLQ
jgi:predicted ThiF/HesA family dinucleotide-utilizing enzyme